jgi:5-methylcytosine-specific restriction protein A
MNRREFSAKTKLQAFERAKGKCEGKDCGARLMPGRYQYDHIVAAWAGGEPTLDNCAVLCIVCHGVKTSKIDKPQAAKSVRIRKRNAGIKKKSRFACSKDSKFKKKMDGSVVLR